MLEESRPKSEKELDAEVLKKRPFIVMNYFDIMVNDSNEAMFIIGSLNFPRDEEHSPRMYYDGGAHAIFFKVDDVAAICDHIHPGVRDLLRTLSEVLIVEVTDEYITDQYMAELVFHPNIEATAKELIELAN